LCQCIVVCNQIYHAPGETFSKPASTNTTVKKWKPFTKTKKQQLL